MATVFLRQRDESVKEKSIIAEDPSGVSGLLWSRVVLAMALTRVGLGYVFGHLTYVLLTKPNYQFAIISRQSWLGLFDRWDAVYYQLIAAQGYPSNLPSLTAFFPGYPLFLRALHVLTLSQFSYLSIADFTSAVLVVASALLLYRVATHFLTPGVSALSAFLFLFYPTSFFFLAPYRESFELFIVLLALLAIERQRWLVASYLGALAAACDPLGLAVGLGIFVVLLTRRMWWKAVLLGLISVSGFLAYVAFLQVRFHNPLEFLAVERFWARTTTAPWWGVLQNTLAFGKLPQNSFDTNVYITWALDDLAALSALFIFLYAIATAWRLRRQILRDFGSFERYVPLAVLLVVGILVPVSSSVYPYYHYLYSTGAEARLLSTTVPAYFLAGKLLSRVPTIMLIVGIAMVVACFFFQSMFNLGYWLT